MIKEFKRELSKVSGVDFFSPKYAEIFKKYVKEEEPTEVEETDKVEEPTTDIEDNKVEELKTDIDKAEDEREIDKIEEEKAESPKVAEEKKEEVNEESEEIGKKVDDLKDNMDDEVFDLKVENELLKNNVRDDKLKTAKDYIKYAIKDDRDIMKIKGILKEYPEWLKREKKAEIESIGRDYNSGDDFTAEERRLKALGIDPR